MSSSFGTVTDVGKVLTPDISLDIGHTHTHTRAQRTRLFFGNYVKKEIESESFPCSAENSGVFFPGDEKFGAIQLGILRRGEKHVGPKSTPGSP